MSHAIPLDATHDPRARSWLESANRIDCDFPIQNLPFAVFRRRGAAEQFRGGVAIGDQIVDLAALARSDMFGTHVGGAHSVASSAAVGIRAGALPSLNSLMQLGSQVRSAVRHALFESLLSGSPSQSGLQHCLVAQHDVEYSVPAQIGDYTDFYTSIYHATAVGRMLRPEQPLLPNYEWVPIGYHGRSSSIGVSQQSFRRPIGQRLAPGTGQPVLGPSRRLDYELELGVFIGEGNAAGAPIPMADAEAHVFGMCLLNDWSARDLQAWEYQPLGPFLAKNFATTVSPWIITLEALAPFRVPLVRPESAPAPLPYLDSPVNRAAGAIDIRVEALIQSAAMREQGEPPYRLSSTSYRHAFWTVGQLITHHTVNGCNLRPGDLLGTGTQSGPTAAEAGSLLELSIGGTRTIQIAANEVRTFLEDGDSVILRGWCEKSGAVRIGFGTAQGSVLAAPRSGG
jgi:fumarylacetoacetase